MLARTKSALCDSARRRQKSLPPTFDSERITRRDKILTRPFFTTTKRRNCQTRKKPLLVWRRSEQGSGEALFPHESGNRQLDPQFSKHCFLIGIVLGYELFRIIFQRFITDGQSFVLRAMVVSQLCVREV